MCYNFSQLIFTIGLFQSKCKSRFPCFVWAVISALEPSGRSFLSQSAPSHDDVIKWKHFLFFLAICAGNSLDTGEFPTQRPVTRGFDVFFDLRLNKRLSKQWWGWWFERPSGPLWRHCNVSVSQMAVCPPSTSTPPICSLHYFDRLVQERRNSIANALELRLSCTNPSILCTSFWVQSSFLLKQFSMSILASQGLRQLGSDQRACHLTWLSSQSQVAAHSHGRIIHNISSHPSTILSIETWTDILPALLPRHLPNFKMIWSMKGNSKCSKLFTNVCEPHFP